MSIHDSVVDKYQNAIFNVFKFLLGFDASENKTKCYYYSSLNVDVIFFAFFPQSFEAKLEF